MLHLFDKKLSKNSNILKNNITINFFFEYLNKIKFSCDGKAEFSVSSSVSHVQKSLLYADLVLNMYLL